jgi:hypothetical protein
MEKLCYFSATVIFLERKPSEFTSSYKQREAYVGCQVVIANIYHVANRAELLDAVARDLGMMALQQGMAVLRPEFEGKILDAEQLLSIESKMFVPMWNIRYILPVIKPMTELPRVEEPGIPLTGQGVETKEHKPS